MNKEVHDDIKKIALLLRQFRDNLKDLELAVGHLLEAEYRIIREERNRNEE